MHLSWRRDILHLFRAGLLVLRRLRRNGSGVVFARALLATLERRELDTVAGGIAAETGMSSRAVAEGEHVAGTYRRRLSLASGRFAIIDDGLSFQLAPWSAALDQHLGRHVTGVARPGGGIDWALGRTKGLSR